MRQLILPRHTNQHMFAQWAKNVGRETNQVNAQVVALKWLPTSTNRLNNIAICHLGVIACREAPKDSSEQVTQLTFGDFVEVLETSGNWLKVRATDDGYQGWVDRKQVLALSAAEAQRLLEAELHVTVQPLTVLQWQDDLTTQFLPMGSQWHGTKDGAGSLNGRHFKVTSDNQTFAQWHAIEKHAKAMLNAPYLWGGKTCLGIDCSGFTQMVYRTVGINLLRDAAQQVTQGEERLYFEDAQPFDLAFFDNAQGKIIHVGIVLPDQQIIHASGKVRIDQLHREGIYNAARNEYTHVLRVLKNVLI